MNYGIYFFMYASRIFVNLNRREVNRVYYALKVSVEKNRFKNKICNRDKIYNFFKIEYGDGWEIIDFSRLIDYHCNRPDCFFKILRNNKIEILDDAINRIDKIMLTLQNEQKDLKRRKSLIYQIKMFYNIIKYYCDGPHFILKYLLLIFSVIVGFFGVISIIKHIWNIF